MKNILKWRLGKLPTSDEVLELVKAKLITNDEARQILFNEEKEEEANVEALKGEIKFLKELVEKLADKKIIVETVKYLQPSYINVPYYQPYYYWANNVTSSLVTTGNTLYATSQANSLVGDNFVNCYNATSSTGDGTAGDISFSQIQTL